MGRLPRFLLGVLLLGSAAAVVQEGLSRPEITDEGRARWEQLSEGERQDLRARYEEFSELEVSEQYSLHFQGQRLDEMARKIYAGLEEEARTKVNELTPAKRRRLLRELATHQASERSQRILDLMSVEDRSRLEQATETDRRRFFNEFEERQRRRLDAVIRDQGPLYFSPAELERLNELPYQDRRSEFLRILKRRTVQWIRETGLPEGVPQERWDTLRSLEPDEFWFAWRSTARAHGVTGPNPERALQPRRRLVHAFQSGGSTAVRIELSGLEPEERKQRLIASQREKVVEVAQILFDEGHMTEADFALLRDCVDQRFNYRVREVISRLGVRSEKE